jgi:cytochrome P450
LRWIRQPIPFMEECVRQFGDCFTVRFPIGGRNIVFFSDPVAIKEIFTGDTENFRAGEANVVVKPILGDHSLLVIDGARHSRERRLMMPPFHGERMQVYSEAMRDIADRSIDMWPVGTAFPIHSSMQGITLDVILRTVFGLDDSETLVQLRDQLIRLLFKATRPYLLLPWFQIDLGPYSPWGRQVRMMKEINALLFATFAQRRAEGPAGRTDILTMLLEARDEDGQPLSDQHLRDEMLTLLIAGHETTATSLSWIFSRILPRPDVMEKLRAELQTVVGTGPVMPKHITQLEYLDATIKETLRLNPIVPLVGRRLQTPTRIGDRELPAGVVASPCIYLTHRRPDLWPEPEQFNPDRFLGKKPTPYEFFPFGGGVRYCLGAAFATYEMKIVLAEILSRTELHLAPGYTPRMVRRGITFAPSEGVPVVVAARH